MKRDIYTLTGSKTLFTVAEAVEKYLHDAQKMECQTLTANDGSLLVQGRGRRDCTKQFFGLDKAVTVKLIPAKCGVFQVEIGHAQWLKKGLVLFVGAVLLSPLLLTTTTIGISNQCKLPKQISFMLQRYLADLPLDDKKNVQVLSA